MAAFDPVTAVLRALDVLRQINRLGQPSITEIHRETGLPKATVLRMIETLISAGYVARVPGSATYAATGRCLLLSNGFRLQARVAAIAGPHMSAFRKKIGWPSDFGIFDIDAMVIIVTNREFGVLSLNRKVGERTPMLLSALGRAYFAFCDEQEQERILATLRESTNPYDRAAKSTTVARRMLNETKARGFSLTDGNYLETVYEGMIWGIGVPVLGAGRALAAMNVMFLRSAMPLEDGIKRLVPVLQAAASKIGSDLVRDGAFADLRREPEPRAQLRKARARS